MEKLHNHKSVAFSEGRVGAAGGHAWFYDYIIARVNRVRVRT